ncbi:hypothetical protein JCM24511_00862 [Saitozyma sp. JCM 24511]|nr:hypothetical protein JCM24511_00862 [Saitozyma sp. JCM 24511]
MSTSNPFFTSASSVSGLGLGASAGVPGTSSAPRPPASTSTTLNSLLAQAQSLNRAELDAELPQIRFGIDEIERMSEAVAGRGKGRKVHPGEGHTLLSNFGINTSHLSHTISHLPADVSGAAGAAGAPAPSAAAHRPRKRRVVPTGRVEPMGDLGPAYVSSEGDLGAWGRNWHEMVILSGIEMQRQKTIKSFQAQFQQKMLDNWEAEKARVLQDELGVTDDELARLAGSLSGSGSGIAGGSGGLAGSTLGRSALGASTRRFPMAQSTMSKSAEGRDGGLVMHTKMVKYERVISNLNERRKSKQPVELCQALEETVKGDQYAGAYLGDPRSANAVLLRGRLTAGGRRFLERDFENHVDEVIAKHPKEAALGGVPGIRNKVRAFVDVTLQGKESQESYKPESVNGSYIWAQAYYLLRCGFPDESLALLSEHQHSIKRDDWSFPGAFKVFLTTPDRRLPRPTRDQLFNDFNASIRNNPNVDQFKYALYKLVGRFELNRKSLKVATTTEDWMWLQLSLVRESKEMEPPQEQYDLGDLGKLVLKYGNDKFDNGGTRPFAWFNLLLFTAQFERAVAYLYSKPQLRTDAVHFAIALAYYGLLRVPSRGDDAELREFDILRVWCCGGRTNSGVVEAIYIADHVVVTSEGEDAFLNFARVIKQYVAPWFKLEPVSALQYAYLVALGADAPGPEGETQKRLSLELVRDVVLASRSWSKLLGSVRADGTKETGVIERDLSLLKLSNSDEYLRAVVLSAAEQSASDSSLIDSIELYHLAGSYDKVVESVNRALGHSLASAGTGSRSGSGGGSGSGTERLKTSGAEVGLSGAFGGAEDLYGLAQRVYSVYEKDMGKRSKVSKGGWETLGTLLRLKQGMAEFAADRPDLALETFKSTNLLPLDTDPSSISRYSARFAALLDQSVISNLDSIIVTTMKCLHRLSQQLKQSPYGDAGRMAALQSYKQQAMGLIQFASGMRLRLGPDVYRQLSSMSAFF